MGMLWLFGEILGHVRGWDRWRNDQTGKTRTEKRVLGTWMGREAQGGCGTPEKGPKMDC